MLLLAGAVLAQPQPVAWVDYSGDRGARAKSCKQLLDMLAGLEGAPQSLKDATAKRKKYRFQSGTGRGAKLYTESQAWATCLVAYRYGQEGKWAKADVLVRQGGFHTKGANWLRHWVNARKSSSYYLKAVRNRASQRGPHGPSGALRRSIVDRCTALLGLNPAFGPKRFNTAWAEVVAAYYAAHSGEPIWAVCASEASRACP